MPSIDLNVRFWEKVDASGDCWEWTGERSQWGYGRILVERRRRLAHRVAYELLVGTVPDGLVLDHLCRNRGCVNPDHLEPVTERVNLMRGVSPSAFASKRDKCPAGHPYSGDNVRVTSSGDRVCRACARRHFHEYKAKRMFAAAGKEPME